MADFPQGSSARTEAYTMVTDSNSKGGIEFSFLENSGGTSRAFGVLFGWFAQKIEGG